MGIRPPERPAGSAALAGGYGSAAASFSPKKLNEKKGGKLLPLRPRAPHGALGLVPGV
jgi:hypothetical protein